MAVPISNVTRRQVYSPSGSGGAGPYSFTFEILANTDIAVYKDDTLLTLTTHYTVTINANGTGSVTITAAGLALSPTSPTQYAIVGNRTIQRTSDFTTGGDFFANTINDELDQQTIFAQQNSEGLQRALTAPQTDPTSIDMTLPRASVRANKTLAFDSNGDPTTGEVIGDNRGNWSAAVAYNKRDIVKDTSNGNIYYANTSHTSSGSQPISTNADSAKWDLIVDNASAGSSATAAAASASAAATSASNASTSASNASTSATNAAASASTASTQASNASTSATNAAASASTASTQASNASTSATNAAASASTASTQASNASTSASNASTSATNAANSASTATTQATNASNSASAASTSASNASTSATNAANSATASASSATSAAASAAAAAASFDAFDDIYLGAKSSDPSVDNDGNALTTGDQYFNTTANELRVYNGSTWQAASTVGGTVTSLSVTGATTLGQNPILSGGTANGVAYLNGSKALTTGSALTFDGTGLAIGNASPLSAGKLSALADLSAVNGLVVRDSATTYANNNNYILLQNSAGATAGALTHPASASLGMWGNDDIRFFYGAGAAEAMRIASATGGVGAVGIGYTSLTSVGNNGLAVLGNVGIGTSSPGYKLDVSGYIRGLVNTASVGNASSMQLTQNGSGDAAISFLIGATTEWLAGVDNSDSDSFKINNITGGSDFNGTGITLTTGGKLLLGVTSGTGLSNGDFAMGNGNHIRFRNAANSAYISAFEFTSANGLNIGTGGSLSTITFGISGIGEAGRFDTSGRMIIGNTTMPVGYGTALNVYTTGVGARVYGTTESAGPFWVDKQTNTSSTSQVFVQFTINTQATGNGQINGNGASQVAFGSFSDRRLKENITDLPPQLANIMALRPVEFDYIESEGGGHQTSFIAQEFEEIYPDAIGERADGMKTLTGWGKTEARLVKAIQEQQAIIQSLTARITALEGA